MKQKSFRSDLHSTDCIRARHVPDAGCTMGTGQCEGVRGQCKQCLGTGSADYTGTGEFSRGSYSGRKNKQRSASYLHKNYQICLNSLLLFRWSLYCSGALTYVYAGCYYGVCRTGHRSLTFGNRLARAAGSGALFRCLYCAGMQRRGTWKNSVGFCRHIPVLFQCGCYFCNYISHKGQSL